MKRSFSFSAAHFSFSNYCKVPLSSIFIFTVIIFTSCTKGPLTGGGGNGGGGSNPLPERIILDTAYGMDPNQKMDIYLPAGRTTATKTVIFIHGGGWESGSKSDGEYAAMKDIVRQKWSEAAVATINYRLTSNPAVHHTEIMNDISAAVNLMVNNKTNFVISDTLTMMGASAGGHLALLYTYKFNTNGYVKAVADFFGPAKLSDWEWYNSYNIWVGKSVKDILIKFNNSPWNIPIYDSNSPFSVATAQSKPTIIFHGNLDAIVPLYQSQWLNGRLNTLGVVNEYYEYFDGHGFNYTNNADAIGKAVSFFKLHLK
jgi:acetyl esterase/lipase